MAAKDLWLFDKEREEYYMRQAFSMNDFKNQSRYEDDIPQCRCVHVTHNPPMHLHIPVGKKYIHVCQGCGETRTIYSSENYSLDYLQTR